MQMLECRNIRIKKIEELKNNQIGDITLAVIQIGDFIENQIYLNSKKKLASKLGVKVIDLKYDKNSSKEEIVDKILELNNNKEITGIMIQKPVLDKYNYSELVNLIDYRKDIDGVGKANKDNLVNGDYCIVPCTVKAILMVFDEYNMSLRDKKIVIVGKSDLVGMPLYNLLKNKYDVILCDSKTPNLSDVTINADIVVVAIGKANYFDRKYFRNGQVIIDVGANYLNGKLVGDVDFDSIKDLSVAITPVPGGVGQLTPVCLFSNLFEIKKNS